MTYNSANSAHARLISELEKKFSSQSTLSQPVPTGGQNPIPVATQPHVQTMEEQLPISSGFQGRDPKPGEVTTIVKQLKEVIKGLAPVEAVASANCLADSLMTFESHLTHVLSSLNEDTKITIVNKIFDYDNKVHFLLASGKNLKQWTAQSERAEAFEPIFKKLSTSCGSDMFQDLATKSNNSPMFFQALVKIAFKVCFPEFRQYFLEADVSNDIEL
jgi:hypothetical protein